MRLGDHWAELDQPTIFRDASLKAWVVERFTPAGDFQRLEITDAKLTELGVEPSRNRIARCFERITRFMDEKLLDGEF